MAAVMGPGTAAQELRSERPTPAAGAICREVQAAVTAVSPQLAAVAPERLVSLSVPLPAALVEGEHPPGGDTRWLLPGGDSALYGSGVADRYADDAAVRYRADCAQWICLGDAAPPAAFFTLPPATRPARPTLWLPRVLLRRDRGRWRLVLTARRGRQAVQQLVDQWLEAVTTLFTPVAGGGQRIVARQTMPDADTWLERVSATRQAIRAGRFAKVVLARRLRAQLSRPVDVAALTAQLARRYPGCHVLSLPYDGGRVVAATPEQLATRRDDTLVSHALAGTAKRSSGGQGEALSAFLASPKERHEHALVVDAIRERMQRLCTGVEHPAVPSLLSLRFVQHLWTPLRGRLRDGVDLLDAVSTLHPTPAVLGTPGAAAQAWLAECGEHRDGLYTGVAGWIDRDGDGDAVVVLRSAYLEGSTAVLWAGAGIVSASEPAAELWETELKLQTMLEVLDAAS